MDKTFSLRLRDSHSDNLKSKIQNLKFAVVVGAMLFALCLPAEAQQQAKIPKIGWLGAGSASAPQRRLFVEGLRELGYVEGKSIIIEYRYAEGKRERLLDLATELVGLKVDVAVGSNTRAALALAEATKTIPIVIASGRDPVSRGLVASLARPGGNVTGISNLVAETDPKRLELLKETFPKISRVAMLWDPGQQRWGGERTKDLAATAQALGVKPIPLAARSANDLETAFDSARKERADALLVLGGPFMQLIVKRVVDLAAKNRLPAIYPTQAFTAAGGLMFYGPSAVERFRRAAYLVDRLLKGAKPADLPVEQPMKFELIINLKTAKQIGLAIPPNVLARADKVIR